MEQIVLAGASFVFGLDEIRDAFLSIGIESSFAEVPYMLKYQKISEKEKIEFTEKISENKIVVPLSEYWISECIKSNNCRISKNALLASRSKKKLYSLLSIFKVPKNFDSIQQAKDFVNQTGKSIIVKPDGLFSGYGIKISNKENIDEVEKFIFNARNVNNRALKLFEIKNNNALVTEYIFGKEYSADIFYFKGKISLVRLCKKEIVFIHGTPCTAVYQLLNPTAEIKSVLEKWCNALFEKENISFGQFDFIEDRDGDFVPIDFAPRIGGGIEELLKCCKKNVYADAVLNIFNQNENNILPLDEKYLSQFNYLPTKSGKIFNDNYKLLSGKKIIYKHNGDFVPECSSSSASRIAVVIARHKSPVEKEILYSLLIGSEHIEFWKK